MALKLTLHTVPDVPLEAPCLNPHTLSGLSTEDIEKQKVMHGNRAARVGDFFRIEGRANGALELEGDLARVKYIGAGTRSGNVCITGDVGAHLGAGMQGGEIHVRGNAGDWVAPEMAGGRITITGDAGHLVGSAYRGSAMGISGGEIIIHGNVRNEPGHAMRNGLIAVGGTAGDFTGVNMLAGTIVVLGEMGIRSGAGMQRGTIVSMQPAEILPTFSHACVYSPVFLRVLLLHLTDCGLAIEEEWIGSAFDRWCGDAVELNRGEILLLKG